MSKKTFTIERVLSKTKLNYGCKNHLKNQCTKIGQKNSRKKRNQVKIIKNLRRPIKSHRNKNLRHISDAHQTQKNKFRKIKIQ